MSRSLDRVPWETFKAERFPWHQGEHVTMIGPTGAGKTTLALDILDRRSWVCALATKPRDRTMDTLVRRHGWKLARTWRDVPAPAHRSGLRVVLWPPYRTPADQADQAVLIDAALREMFAAGGWCVFADELFYLTRMLGLGPVLEAVWTQGRSIGLSLVGSTQRPRHVPLLAYDQATHLFLWRDNDEQNLRRLAGLNGLRAGVIRATVAQLPRHDVLYVNTRTGDMCITRAPRQ